MIISYRVHAIIPVVWLSIKYEKTHKDTADYRTADAFNIIIIFWDLSDDRIVLQIYVYFFLTFITE